MKYPSESKLSGPGLAASEDSWKSINIGRWDSSGPQAPYTLIFSKDAKVEPDPNEGDTVFGRLTHQVTKGTTDRGYTKIEKYMKNGEVVEPGPGIGQTGLTGTDHIRYTGQILKVRDPRQNLQIVDGSRGGTISKPTEHYDQLPAKTGGSPAKTPQSQASLVSSFQNLSMPTKVALGIGGLGVVTFGGVTLIGRQNG